MNTKKITFLPILCSIFIIFSSISLWAGDENLELQASAKNFSIKVHPLDVIVGLYSGEVEFKLSRQFSIFANAFYLKASFEALGGLEMFGVNSGVKWFFTGQTFDSGFYLAPRLGLWNDVAGDSRLVFVPSALVGYQWLSKIGLVLDVSLGANLMAFNGQHGLSRDKKGQLKVRVMPTINFGMGWAI